MRKDRIFSVISIYSNFISSMQECDAAIVTTSYAYESVSLDAMKQWFSEMQKEVHVLGPLLPPGYDTKTNGEEGASVNIETFLEEVLIQHGERSVYFVRSFFFSFNSNLHNFSQISFGSFHWPSVPEYVDELIEALISKKAPFVRYNCFSYNKNIRFMLVTESDSCQSVPKCRIIGAID